LKQGDRFEGVAIDRISLMQASYFLFIGLFSHHRRLSGAIKVKRHGVLRCTLFSLAFSFVVAGC